MCRGDPVVVVFITSHVCLCTYTHKSIHLYLVLSKSSTVSKFYFWNQKNTHSCRGDVPDLGWASGVGPLRSSPWAHSSSGCHPCGLFPLSLNDLERRELTLEATWVLTQVSSRESKPRSQPNRRLGEELKTGVGGPGHGGGGPCSVSAHHSAHPWTFIQRDHETRVGCGRKPGWRGERAPYPQNCDNPSGLRVSGWQRLFHHCILSDCWQAMNLAK